MKLKFWVGNTVQSCCFENFQSLVPFLVPIWIFPRIFTTSKKICIPIPQAECISFLDLMWDPCNLVWHAKTVCKHANFPDFSDISDQKSLLLFQYWIKVKLHFRTFLSKSNFQNIFGIEIVKLILQTRSQMQILYKYSSPLPTFFL